jgi:hypothetical protein
MYYPLAMAKVVVSNFLCGSASCGFTQLLHLGWQVGTSAPRAPSQGVFNATHAQLHIVEVVSKRPTF